MRDTAQERQYRHTTCTVFRTFQLNTNAQGWIRKHSRKPECRQINADEQSRRRESVNHHFKSTDHTPPYPRNSQCRLTDVIESPTKNADFLAKVAKEKVPVLLVINKIDLLKGNADLVKIMDLWKGILPNAEVFPMSAKENFNVSNLMKRIVELLPDSPPYFGKDALTDKPARFFVTEIIREKILLEYDKEVPYAAEVLVEKFEEKPESIHIMSVIYVERDSQKGIIIGHGGIKLKHVGIAARRDIERFFGKRVFLEMFVKVEKDWRNRENKLRSFGYIE